jgi:hypothetical protein
MKPVFQQIDRLRLRAAIPQLLPLQGSNPRFKLKQKFLNPVQPLIGDQFADDLCSNGAENRHSPKRALANRCQDISAISL